MQYLNKPLDEFIKDSKKPQVKKGIKKFNQNTFLEHKTKRNVQHFPKQQNYMRTFNNFQRQNMFVRKAIGQKECQILRVENLDKNISITELQELFGACGEVETIDRDLDSNGDFKGSGEVYYKNIESARKAIKEYNGANLDGLQLKIKYHIK